MTVRIGHPPGGSSLPQALAAEERIAASESILLVTFADKRNVRGVLAKLLVNAKP